jgi:aminoglycoside phosphotransferase (APT) family kinase protein
MSDASIAEILAVLDLIRREQAEAKATLSALETIHAESSAANRAAIGKITFHVGQLAANQREMGDQLNTLQKRVNAIPEIFERCKSHCVIENTDQLSRSIASAIRDTSTNLPAMPERTPKP